MRSRRSVPSADEIAHAICRARTDLIMQGRAVRVTDDAEALHAWLAERARRRTRVALYAAVAVVAALLLSGCGELKQGVVEGKEHRAEKQGVYWVPIQTGTVCTGGKYNTCTPIFTPFPFNYRDPERWVLRMRDGKKTGKFYVSREMWERTQIGDRIEADGSVSTKAPDRIRGDRAEAVGS